MSVRVVWRKDQLIKENYNGSVRERKIIGFPGEKSPIPNYSNIFYWAHIVSDYGGIISERPVIGFEILTFVLRGCYESYNPKTDRWTQFQEGDMEIIQAGKGIKHKEKMHSDSEILKIWLDPNFNQFRRIAPAINQYWAGAFPTKNLEGIKTTILKGKDVPLQMNAEGVSMQINYYDPGDHKLSCKKDCTLSCYIIKGYLDLNGKTLTYFDFFVIEDKAEITIQALSDCKIFMVTSPLQPEYQMYSELRMQ
jgi:redox-sensitive bicupin YhaK (pirin superfamily)